jgi:UDP-2-acetamido-3-amino-2,3-dideoxy-glucuronate N-acetyltransferase
MMEMMAGYYVHPTAVLDDGCSIGKGSRIWHFTHVMSNATIGENCVLGQNVMVASGVTLGDNVKVQNNVSIFTGVHCEDDVFLGPSVVFTNVKNPRSAISRKSEFKTTYVKKGATIGANSTIICGVSIGEYAFVAAGSVVTHDVLPYSLVIGNPAIPSGWISEYAHRLQFNPEGRAFCPETQQEYRLIENRVSRIL